MYLLIQTLPEPTTAATILATPTTAAANTTTVAANTTTVAANTTTVAANTAATTTLVRSCLHLIIHIYA